ncbi:universal stress protein [Oceanospirillum maris]|jgi:nucleotide-binding universal stress UspA family protein|uniref:universal stress protein n=1 Tax=Oceanospirillum maris TaxID=64977 RepID=UPI000414DF56|nr:universal stress protein [Oceanospirillum maris]
MYNTVLIPMDLEHENMFPKAVALAQQLIGDENGEIHAIYVDQNMIHNGNFSLSSDTVKQVQNDMKQQVKSLFKKHVPEHLRGKCRVKEGVVYDTVLETAEKLKPEVIIVAAGRPGLSSYLLGSNAEKILRHAQCSVFVVRDEHKW